MPLKLSAPIVKEFELERSDEKYGTDGKPTTIKVKQATQRQNELRQDLFAEYTQVMNLNRPDDEMQYKANWNFMKLMRKEVFLTLVDSNLQDADGKPLFNFDVDKTGTSWLAMTEADFERAWGKLPDDICREIHEKVLEVNLTWQNPTAGAGRS